MTTFETIVTVAIIAIVVLLMESKKLVFTDEFYKDFEKVLKGGQDDNNH